MANDNFNKAVQQFAENAGAKISHTQDGGCVVTFPGERYPAIIDTDMLGFSISFATWVATLSNPSDTSVAPGLLLKNWGSISGTGFYYSVNVQDGKPWVFLETVQYLQPNASYEVIVDILGMCWVQCRQAKEALQIS